MYAFVFVSLQASKRENTHKVDVKNCLVGQVGHGGITVQGDVAVTIKNNVFKNLEDGALKVSALYQFFSLGTYILWNRVQITHF